jgi:hypothetical protein
MVLAFNLESPTFNAVQWRTKLLSLETCISTTATAGPIPALADSLLQPCFMWRVERICESTNVVTPEHGERT